MGLFDFLKKDNKKEFKLKAEDIKKVIEWDELTGDGCIVSDRITKDGFKVGYMIRREPPSDKPLSGWWFLAGDEDDKYCNDTSKFSICKINTVCNYDSDIIKHLHSAPGSEYIRIDESNFILDDKSIPIYITKQDKFKNK